MSSHPQNRHLLENGSSSDRSDSESEESGDDFDTALELTGNGKFHHFLLLVCGLANASDAIEVLCISFLLPSAECELKLTQSDKGWLSAIMFIGLLVGGYWWGCLSDSLGRKPTLIAAMLINAFSGMFSSLIISKPFFMFFRFISGVGVGGSIPVTWSYFAEFQPRQRRGSQLSLLATFWMIGNILVAALAWLIIPRQIGGVNQKYNLSWRVFTAVCGSPALISGILLCWLPESPKYLLTKHQDRKALRVLKTMYNLNQKEKSRSLEYPVTQLSRAPSRAQSDSTRRRTFSSSVREIFSNTSKIFTLPSVRMNTYKMLYINFSIAFGYYGLWLWFPELFNKLSTYYKYHPNDSVSICQVTDFVPPQVNATEDIFCHDNGVPRNDVFLNSFLISISALPGNLWTIFHMDKLGRKFFLILGMVLSGCSAFLIYLVSSATSNLVVSCIFGVVSTMGFNSLDCLGAELFPTELRSTAMAVTLAAGRLGAILANIVFGYFISVTCALPILSVAALLVSGGLLGFFLPNTTNIALH